MPVLMLTARADVRDRIRGLDGGADDYLVKPFDFGELVARLRALTRRAAVRAADGGVRRGRRPAARRRTRRRGGARRAQVELTAREFARARVPRPAAGPRRVAAELLADGLGRGLRRLAERRGRLRRLPAAQARADLRRRRLIRTVRGVGLHAGAAVSLPDPRPASPPGTPCCSPSILVALGTFLVLRLRGGPARTRVDRDVLRATRADRRRLRRGRRDRAARGRAARRCRATRRRRPGARPRRRVLVAVRRRRRRRPLVPGGRRARRRCSASRGSSGVDARRPAARLPRRGHPRAAARPAARAGRRRVAARRRGAGAAGARAAAARRSRRAGGDRAGGLVARAQGAAAGRADGRRRPTRSRSTGWTSASPCRAPRTSSATSP